MTKAAYKSGTDPLALDVEEIKRIKADLKNRRKKKTYSRSKLRPYYAEVKRLKEEFKFSFPDISLWLRHKKKVVLSKDGVRAAYRRIEQAEKLKSEKM